MISPFFFLRTSGHNSRSRVAIIYIAEQYGKGTLSAAFLENELGIAQRCAISIR